MKPKRKPRTIWCVEKTENFVLNKQGIAYGLLYETRKEAIMYGKPVKFVEVLK